MVQQLPKQLVLHAQNLGGTACHRMSHEVGSVYFFMGWRPEARWTPDTTSHLHAA